MTSVVGRWRSVRGFWFFFKGTLWDCLGGKTQELSDFLGGFWGCLVRNFMRFLGEKPGFWGVLGELERTVGGGKPKSFLMFYVKKTC